MKCRCWPDGARNAATRRRYFTFRSRQGALKSREFCDTSTARVSLKKKDLELDFCWNFQQKSSSKSFFLYWWYPTSLSYFFCSRSYKLQQQSVGYKSPWPSGTPLSTLAGLWRFVTLRIFQSIVSIFLKYHDSNDRNLNGACSCAQDQDAMAFSATETSIFSYYSILCTTQKGSWNLALTLLKTPIQLQTNQLVLKQWSIHQVRILFDQRWWCELTNV